MANGNGEDNFIKRSIRSYNKVSYGHVNGIDVPSYCLIFRRKTEVVLYSATSLGFLFLHHGHSYALYHSCDVNCIIKTLYGVTYFPLLRTIPTLNIYNIQCIVHYTLFFLCTSA